MQYILELNKITGTKEEDRSSFLQTARALTSRLMICMDEEDKQYGQNDRKTSAATSGNLGEFGIPLYTLRDVILANPQETLM